MSVETAFTDEAFTARTTISEVPDQRNARCFRTGPSLTSHAGGGGGGGGGGNWADADTLRTATVASVMTDLKKTWGNIARA